MSLQAWIRRRCESFSYVGLVVATLFFSASLSPSLLPRINFVQGLLSGFALAAGYGVGVALVWLWQYLELPVPRDKLQRVSKRITTVAVAMVAIGFLWRAAVWQNSIRKLMGMDELETADPWLVGLIAVAFGVLLIFGARLIGACGRFIAAKLNRVLPRRVANILSAVVVAYLLVVLANGVLARQALNVADAVFLKMDEAIDEGIEQPSEPTSSGSAESLIPWDTIGRQGKNFIIGGPKREDLQPYHDQQAQRPLRVYVGLRSAETHQQRAKLALEELKRVKAFDRSLLVVATPTGTGWLDPGAVDTVEYLHGGDTAIVSMQYSYLPSWITILVDPTRSKVAARALFDEVYAYWTKLPTDSRPKLYLQGLSLGSLGSESCADLFTIFEDPIQGALWSGPPFPSANWNAAIRNRNPGSPAWLPTFHDGSMLRFTAQENALDRPGERWGSMRLVYIQYASDPMVFFSPSLFYEPPTWLSGGRGPDVSPYLNWYPIVTFLQIAFDLPMATSVPIGYGHNYAPDDYIDGWIAVTDPPKWDDETTRRLKAALAD